MTKPIRIEARIKNNILWQAINARKQSLAAFCHLHKLNYRMACLLLNLRLSPFLMDGEYRPVCLELAQILGYEAHELFPKELYTKLITTNIVREYEFDELPFSGDEIKELPSPETPHDAALATEVRETVKEALSFLLPREAYILRRRFGIEEETATLEQLADEMRTSPQRICQIEAVAMRFLRGERKRPSDDKGKLDRLLRLRRKLRNISCD